MSYPAENICKCGHHGVSESHESYLQRKRKYDRAWREEHRSELRTRYREYEKKEERRKYHHELLRRLRKLNPDWRIREAKKKLKRRQMLRLKVLTILGLKCARCGYDKDWRAFQIDHINGGGEKDRKSMRSVDAYYKQIEKNFSNYQTLCANCNQIKKYEQHEVSRGKKTDEN